jgi:hypothetical protein
LAVVATKTFQVGVRTVGGGKTGPGRGVPAGVGDVRLLGAGAETERGRVGRDPAGAVDRRDVVGDEGIRCRVRVNTLRRRRVVE